MKTPAPQFRPAFEIGDKVRVKPDVEGYGGLEFAVTCCQRNDHYRVEAWYGDQRVAYVFARKELERA